MSLLPSADVFKSIELQAARLFHRELAVVDDGDDVHDRVMRAANAVA
ncbi:hypothetical protein M2283_002496 [Streptomyces pseudovenezuelae]|uniref:Uncharacterized protein n=1 Tax=Streptomyces pseudovenezuelae TaxID=67350 RepID=A0ABT6LFY4_9ACTN|nr:hypothetical protein [Streptomyces pseudovenezuelae]